MRGKNSAIAPPGGRILTASLFVMGLVCSSISLAHTPQVDADLSDWCLGAPSNGVFAGRIEDSSANLECGNCSTSTNLACEVAADCPVGETCVNLTSKSEIVWWDNRTDGAVNDLGTVAVTTDANNIYFVAELWVDPDPTSLPFAEIAIDFKGGGNGFWYDPQNKLVAPGRCSNLPDRACTNPLDCHFCATSTEPFPSDRRRTCGSDNNSPPVNGSGMCSDETGDVCVRDGTCLDVGTTPIQGVGLNSSPSIVPDHLLVFDFSRWLLGVEGGKSVLVMTAAGGNWVPGEQFVPLVNPGASGGSGGPPGSVEVAIPWTAFGGSGFGPGVDFRFTIMVARGTTTLDYTPDGAIEDTVSESVAGTTTTTTNSCPGFGTVTTNCEIADGSMDGFLPPPDITPQAGGSTSDLLIGVGGAKGIGAVDLFFSWDPSCATLDTDYEIYAGTMGDYYGHQSLTCSTGGATSATVTAGDGNEYYLIVPSNGETEGSYGQDSEGNERPAGVPACLTQLLGTCL